MRNLILGVTLVSALGTYGHAQGSAPAPQSTADKPGTTTAERVERGKDATTLSGNVTIVMDGGAVITADKAVFDHISNEIELVGNVRLKPPQGKQ